MFSNNLLGIFLIGILGILWIWSLKQVRGGNTFKTTPWLLPLGIFVWGDGLVILLFWIAWLIFSMLVQNIYISLTLWALFWVVRSLGEVIYWLNQQFSIIKRNDPKSLLGGKLFGEGVWFVYQIAWQCVLVIMIFVTIWSLRFWNI